MSLPFIWHNAHVTLSYESQKLLTAATYIDFMALFLYTYTSLLQIVPTQICKVSTQI